MIPEKTVRKMGARRLAKEFKSRIGTNLAIKLPDDIIDRLGDDQVDDFFAYCEQFGLVRRDDCFWEREI